MVRVGSKTFEQIQKLIADDECGVFATGDLLWFWHLTYCIAQRLINHRNADPIHTTSAMANHILQIARDEAARLTGIRPLW